jgi:hypothetical protein
MSSDPLTSVPAGAAPPAERRPAVWPWLLLPLVALALFFALREVKGPDGHGEGAAASAPGEASGSR